MSLSSALVIAISITMVSGCSLSQACSPNVWEYVETRSEEEPSFIVTCKWAL